MSFSWCCSHTVCHSPQEHKMTPPPLQWPHHAGALRQVRAPRTPPAPRWRFCVAELTERRGRVALLRTVDVAFNSSWRLSLERWCQIWALRFLLTSCVTLAPSRVLMVPVTTAVLMLRRRKGATCVFVCYCFVFPFFPFFSCFKLY